MRRLTTREQRIFALTILMVLAYVSFQWMFKPLKERVRLIAASIEAKKSAILKYQRVIRKAAAEAPLYDRYYAEFKQDKTNEQVMSSILSEIESVAGELKLQISDMKPNRVKREDYFNLFSVSLTVESELSEIVEFLYYLQQEPHLFGLEEINFDKGARRKETSVRTNFVLSKVFISEDNLENNPEKQ